jgi:hypothetical protein
MLIIEPYGGLGNRMRVINSAIFLSRELKREILILWKISKELNCSIENLFAFPSTIRIIQFHVLNLPKRFILNLKYSRTSKKIISEELMALSKNGFDISSLREYKSVYIKTCSSFFPYTDYNLFKPIPKLAFLIAQYADHFNSHIIGVHIRRTDNKTSINYSKTELFINLIKKEISTDPGIKFYLATDSPEEEKDLQNIFGEKIISHKKNWKRNSKKGVQDALVELFCLSRTRMLYASYYSSFSDVAAEIGQIKKIQVGAPLK